MNGSIGSIFRYKGVFTNWQYVIFGYLRGKYPIIAKMKDGHTLAINNPFQLWLTSYGIYTNYDEKTDITSFSFKNHEYKFKGASKNGDLADVFGSVEFKSINFLNKIVLDIGANIGDSSIYFATLGAKKVIAVEPFPKSFESLKENVILNEVSDKVVCLNLAVSDKNGKIHLDESTEDSTTMMALDQGNGIEVQTKTLYDLIRDYEIKDSVLKIDCEGCEYDIFKDLNPSYLNFFEYIWMEYHSGLKMTKRIILQKLKEAGFHYNIQKKGGKVGYIIAYKCNEKI